MRRPAPAGPLMRSPRDALVHLVALTMQAGMAGLFGAALARGGEPFVAPTSGALAIYFGVMMFFTFAEYSLYYRAYERWGIRYPFLLIGRRTLREAAALLALPSGPVLAVVYLQYLVAVVVVLSNLGGGTS